MSGGDKRMGLDRRGLLGAGMLAFAPRLAFGQRPAPQRPPQAAPQRTPTPAAAVGPPPAVFVHGNGDSSALWINNVWRFESNGYKREQLFAIDFPYPTARRDQAKPE